MTGSYTVEQAVCSALYPARIIYTTMLIGIAGAGFAASGSMSFANPFEQLVSVPDQQYDEPVPDFVAIMRDCRQAPTTRCYLDAHEAFQRHAPDKILDGYLRQYLVMRLQDPDMRIVDKFDNIILERIDTYGSAIAETNLAIGRASSHSKGPRSERARSSLEEGIQRARALAIPQERDKALRYASSVALDSIGDLDWALEIAEDIGDPDTRLLEAYPKLIKALIDAGRSDEARVMANEVVDIYRSQPVSQYLAVDPSGVNFRLFLNFLVSMDRDDTIDEIWNAYQHPDVDRSHIQHVSIWKNLMRAKRRTMINRGEFPALADLGQYWYLEGTRWDIARDVLDAGNFDYAVEVLGDPWSTGAALNFYLEMASAALETNDIVRFRRAFDSIVSLPQVDHGFVSYTRFAELFTKMGRSDSLRRQLQESGDTTNPEQFQVAGCKLFSASAGLAAQALSRGETTVTLPLRKGSGSHEDRAATTERAAPTLDRALRGLVASGCDDDLISWLSDPRVEDYTSQILIAAARKALEDGRAAP